MSDVTKLGVATSAVFLMVLFAAAVLLGRRVARSGGNVRATTAAIASAVALFVAIHPFNILIDIDSRDFIALIVFVEFALIPVVAGVVAWSATEQSRRRTSVVASVVPALILALILNPVTEFFIACAFGRSIYMTQFFGFAGCV